MEFTRNTRKLRAISMISLIDIVFVLILFFLVGGHLEKYSPVGVDLPHADSGQIMEEGPIVVVLGKYGEVVINDKTYEDTKIPQQLKTELKINPERVITIKADAYLEANKLVDFLEQIRAAGGRNLSIITQSGTIGVTP